MYICVNNCVCVCPRDRAHTHVAYHAVYSAHVFQFATFEFEQCRTRCDIYSETLMDVSYGMRMRTCTVDICVLRML